jgi:hypothetical protein
MGFQEKSGYYRAGTRPVEVPYDRETTLFEFIVPLQPLARLDPDRIEHYRAILREGHAPTAIALSAYDSKGSMEVDVQHFIATNFLVDGHHKVEAAHLERKEITVLAFISTALAPNQDPLKAHRAIAERHALLPLWSPEGLSPRVAAISDILARHDPLRLPPRPDGFPKDVVWRDYRWEAAALASLLDGLQYPPSTEDLIAILAEEFRWSIAQGTLTKDKLAAIAQDLHQHGLT